MMEESSLMCEHSMGNPYEDILTLCREVSHANHIALLEKEVGQRMSETYGLNICELCKNVGLLLSSEKMSGELLPMVLPAKSCQNCRMQAIVQSPLSVGLVPLVDHSHEQGCSLLPTPL